MGMASVSWLYLFNIQVRANCTTACNIQAALQYVELTRISSSGSRFFFFLCICFVVQKGKKKRKIPKEKTDKQKKTCMRAWNEFQSHAGPLRLVGEGPVGPTEDEALAGVGVPTGRPGRLRFTFTETHEEKCPSGWLGRMTELDHRRVGFFVAPPPPSLSRQNKNQALVLVSGFAEDVNGGLLWGGTCRLLDVEFSEPRTTFFLFFSSSFLSFS